VNAGTGIGVGLIIRGELFRGSVGTAGEIGHLSIDLDGPICGCGKQGCVEAYSSSQAVLREIRDALSAGALSLVRDLAHGDVTATTVEMVARAAIKSTLAKVWRTPILLSWIEDVNRAKWLLVKVSRRLLVYAARHPILRTLADQQHCGRRLRAQSSEKSNSMISQNGRYYLFSCQPLFTSGTLHEVIF